MVRLAVTLLLAVTLSLLAVTHCRLFVPTSTDPSTAVAVPDERDPPKPTAESDEANASTEKFVVVPPHRLADPGLLRDLGISLRLPTHRRHPCRHGHGHRWWGHHHDHRHGHGLVSGFPGETRTRLDVPVEWVNGDEARKEEEEVKRVADPDADSDSDSDGEDEEEEEMEKRWKKEKKERRKKKERRFHHHHHHHHHHGEEEEEGGVMKWFRDLLDRF